MFWVPGLVVIGGWILSIVGIDAESCSVMGWRSLFGLGCDQRRHDATELRSEGFDLSCQTVDVALLAHHHLVQFLKRSLLKSEARFEINQTLVHGRIVAQHSRACKQEEPADCQYWT